uniref:G-protein coupled receptors family 1 profile domain-containing protein n=1 Tax=Ditylenchus dipsaci TaxID=166011 RepID=A0A915EIF6_9BILA
MVGLFVTPLGAWATLRQAWHLGVTLCDFWISMDVLVCTSSILHLVAIALDRYWSVTDIYYVQNRTPKRIFFMLMIIWVLSLLISLAPIFGWKDAQFVNRVRQQHVCLISQQISYQVFSTATAFYIPLCAIIIVYWKIMRAARKRFRRERDRRTINRAACAFDDTAKNKVVAVVQNSNAPPIMLPMKLLLPTKQLVNCVPLPHRKWPLQMQYEIREYS